MKDDLVKDLGNDCISRQAAINVVRKAKDKSEAHRMLVQLPPAQLAQDLTKGCTDTISRAAVVDVIEGVDWYHQNKSGEMVHGANDDEHQAWYKAEDIYKAIESVPSAQLEIVRCGQCKYAEVADAQDNQDGYTCQFHRGSIWFSGSYCSWGERRTDDKTNKGPSC